MTVCSKCRIEILLSEKLKTSSYCKKCRAINAVNYRKNNPDKIKERNQDHYYIKGGQERKKIRDKENLEKTRIRDNLRYQKDFNFRIKKVLRTRMNKKIKKRDNSSIDILGCTVDFFRNWMSFQFTEEMNWENYGDYWNIDHVNPCDNFDFSDISQQYDCFNWKNTRPIKALLNFSKNNQVDSKLIQEHNKLSNIFLSQYQK